MTPEEIKKLALDIRGNLVFGTWMLRAEENHMIGSIFMVILFMEPEERKKMIDAGVVHFYEYNSKAGPRSVNGYPIFTSVRMLTKKDSEEVQKILTALEEAEKKALEGL